MSVGLAAGVCCLTGRSGNEAGAKVRLYVVCCSKIAEAEAAVSVNEKKWLVMLFVCVSVFVLPISQHGGLLCAIGNIYRSQRS
jgi:hypothetical protein